MMSNKDIKETIDNDTALKIEKLSIKTEESKNNPTSKSVNDTNAPDNLKNDKYIDEILEEINDRETRKSEVIIFNVPEPSSCATAEETKFDHDRRIVREIFKELGLDDSTCVPKYLRRIGHQPKQEDKESNPRPLIVSFYTQYEKELVISKTKLLKDSKLFSSLVIHANLTLKQREQGKRERELVKQRNETKLSLKKNEEWVWISLGVIRKRKVKE